MKQRILTLALALVLVCSAVAVPVHAASGKDVHAYLKSFAMEGSYSSEDQVWYNGFQIGSNGSGSFYFAINYLEQTKYIQNSIVYYANDDNYLSWEVTWKISSNPSPSYNAFVEVYDAANSANDTKGTIVLPASYKGGTISSFDRGFTGNTAYKSAMLEILNNFLPGVLEYTRAVINENDYALADLGMTGYKKCDWVHAYDHGQITQPPTCVGKGVKTYSCRVCGSVYTEEIDPTGEHSWDQGAVAVPATCTEPGVKRYTCAVCHTTRDEAIPALGHAWNGGVTAEEPDCVTEGILRYTCARCQQTRDEAIPALGHLWTYTETLTEDPETGHGTALYTCARCSETKEDIRCASVVFADMPKEGNWAHAPIDWAYFNGITSGKAPGYFMPKDTVTRAEAMSFLWLTLGSPEPESTENPFADVKEGKYYYKPVLWAVENGITSGTSETTFGPKDPCTRAQILTFIWIAAGRPEPETTENPFTDVKEDKYYYKAVLWGVENQITSGIAPDEFGTNNTCTRAQIVAFLYKAKDLMHQDPAPQPDPEPDPDPDPDPTEPTEPFEPTEPTDPTEPVPDPEEP